MKTLVWHETAISDLEAIDLYIGADSPRAAKRVVSFIRGSAQKLQFMPESGRLTRDSRLREKVLTRYPYTLVYEIVGDEVRVLTIVHQSRDRL